MKSISNTLSTLAVAVLAGFAAVSCADTNNNGGGSVPLPDDMFYNFATYNGSAESSSSFTVQRDGDSGEATVTFSQTFTKDQLKAGNRVFMAYTTVSGQQYVSGPGTLYSLSNATGDAPVAATADNSVRLSTPVKMTEVKRTGDYLNMVFQVPAQRSLKRMLLTVAENKKDPAYPVLGLYVRSDDETGDYRYARVSFDIKDVLAPADVKGIKVAYFDEKGVDTLTFVANTGSVITPTE
ncbi:MAG: hypothetical protein JFR38_05455 [Muribaculaceae bacterium]|nr:hypothetical protein [Muribaculaceae bacterium]